MKQLEKKSRKEPAEAQAVSEQPAESAPAQATPAANAQPPASTSSQPAKVANIAMIATLAKDEERPAEEPQAEAEPEARPAEEPQAEAEAQQPAPATVAHCSAEETVAVTDAELQSRTDPAANHGAEPVATASPEAPAMVNAAEVEKLVNEAYLRGRNEAVKCRMIADTSLFGDVATQDTTGMRADFSSLFETRKSVWGNAL